MGEIKGTDFISASALATAVGLSTVGSVDSRETVWLKFKDPVDGKTKYVARHFIRHGISWNQLNQRGLVTGKQITVDDKLYAVRLFRTRPIGAATIPGIDGYDLQPTHGSEWNRLMYHIVKKPFFDPANTLASEGIVEGDWASYSETELDLISFDYDLCAELSTTGFVLGRGSRRGASAVTILDRNSTSSKWRPILELIE